MSKSAGYCHARLSDGIGLMLLCEVAAKPFHELINSDYNADKSCKAAGKRVTKGLGRVQPLDWQDAGDALENDALKGVHMPKGKPSDVTQGNYSLYYNEVRDSLLFMCRSWITCLSALTVYRLRRVANPAQVSSHGQDVIVLLFVRCFFLACAARCEIYVVCYYCTL